MLWRFRFRLTRPWRAKTKLSFILSRSLISATVRRWITGFRLITGVSGMGAASARMILSSMTSGELEEAILSENVNALKSVKGIGLKSAQRMILELKDKIVKGGAASSDMLFQADSNAAADEASSALQMLGFTKANVTKAIQAILKANPRATVEQIIKSALQML